MAPPPRPPTLTTPNSSSSHLAAPPRPSSGPLPNRLPASSASYDRQPGTSTLAPPPSHSSKPAQPRRPVTLRPGHSPLDWARLASTPGSEQQLRGLAPGTPYLRVTPRMLRRQTGRRGRDAWTALGGRVYNLTAYLPFHPGGEPELLRAAARDGSRLFAEVHPWVNYETMLAACLVGLLVDEAEAESNGEMDAMD
ncbi:cytochrome b5-like heme/steroid binding domain-containing protein [Biscogniauxia mediterranea]|nr:cytochrome b5-like heme/steroid binding domain-containing protein [Biscogniauxia mediterranea]